MISPPYTLSTIRTPANPPVISAQAEKISFSGQKQAEQDRKTFAYKQTPLEKQALLSRAYPEIYTDKTGHYAGNQFAANPLANSQFASLVQVPVLQTLREAEAKTPEKSKNKLEKFVLLGPALMLAGGLSWILKDRNKLFNPVLKLLKKEALPKIPKGAETLEKTGKILLASGSGLLSLNGISAGVVSDQPSMVVSNIIQLIPSILIGFVKKDHLKNFAASLMMLTGAMYTTGFANELKNKEDATPANEVRRYDMTRFKSVFDQKNQAGLFAKAGIAFEELGKMFFFTAVDHAKLLPNAYHNLTQHFATAKAPQFIPAGQNTPAHFAAVPQKRQSGQTFDDLKAWINKPTADKSQVAAIFMILGALPIVLFTHRKPDIGNSALVKTLKTIGMAFGNLSLFSIAIHRDDIKGKAPLLGIPLSVFGMGSSTNGLRIGMGYTGESINSLFFSDVAVNGVETGNGKEVKTIKPPDPEKYNKPGNNPFAQPLTSAQV
ncbi:MAG: hypothetical protein VKJ04_07005 [Vampirovibrionales bacterium]|nr:hypothetical protein [Vampirovibrionales bacterium]